MGPSEPEAIEMSNDIEAEDASDSPKFVCGVVEGFYGRPWSEEQRCTLFKRMAAQGLNTYVYAPKDDYKHRAYWREMYNADEIQRISSLVRAAKENGIVFYYAISPGLDISFSNEADVEALKKKLAQVKELGCEAFSLLFDDIDPQLSLADLQKYPTSAHAQAAVTNVMYEHLGGPKFLFCPTEYCATRALPTVKSSPYLNTIGRELHPDVRVMWTGYQVISATIGIDSIKEVGEVLRRHPVVWDNIHANDYDQKRVFLGPFDGRAPELKPHLGGVLTNPNCEFECNWVAVHTLAQWHRCSVSLTPPPPSSRVEPMKEDDEKIATTPTTTPLPPRDIADVATDNLVATNSLQGCVPFPPPNGPLPPISSPASPPVAAAAAALDVQSSIPVINGFDSGASDAAANPFYSSPDVTPLEDGVYCPLTALKIALKNWVNIFNTPTKAESVRPLLCKWTAPPIVPVPMAPLPGPTTYAPAPVVPMAPFPSTPINHMNDLQEIKGDSSFQPVSNPVNALAASLTPPSSEPTPPRIETDSVEALSENPSGEPMDCAPSPSSSPGDNDSGVVGVSTSFVSDHPDELCDRDLASSSISEGDVDVEFREISGLSGSSSTVTGLTDSVDEDATVGSDAAGQADAMQVDETASPNHASASISESLSSENTSASGTNSESSTITLDANAGFIESPEPMTDEDIFLLADLFYTPFAHGSRGLHLLFEFEWLKCNAYVVEENRGKKESSKEAQQWHARAASFLTCCSFVTRLFRRLLKCAHRPLVHELYSYMWDVRYTIDMMESFVKWLATGHLPFLSCRLLQGRLSWCTQGYREAFTSGEHEPWVFRGGLVAELQRMLPIEAARDLFNYGIPDISIALQTFSIRPYSHADEIAVYEICRKTCDDGSDGSHGFPNHPDLIGDKLVGAFVTLSPEQCFVVEDDLGICGYVVAAQDAKKFIRMTEMSWIPEMCLKYPKKSFDSPKKLAADGLALLPDEDKSNSKPDMTQVKEIISSFHSFAPYLPESLYTAFPSVLRIGLLPRIKDFTLGRRLMATVFSVLRANGNRGVHVTIPVEDKHTTEFYYSLGFTEVRDLVDKPENIIVLGRMM